MTNTSLWSDYSLTADRLEAPNSNVPPRTAQNDLDKNAFLMLLITQMKYQDPLSPMDDKEFVAQMAQFSALEQMQNLNKSFTYTQSFSLIGKYVDGQTYNEITGAYSEFAGRVNSVAMRFGEAFLRIGVDDNIVEARVSEVENVYEDYYAQSIIKSMGGNSFVSQSLSLAGRTIE